MSYIAAFLELHREAPELARPLYQAVLGYVHADDFEGAKPWLDKAAKVAPDDPWVNLAKAFWHGRQFQREEAVVEARKALLKSEGDSLALAVSVRRIAHNWGITDSNVAAEIAETMQRVESDIDRLTDALSLLIERDGYNPAHLAVAYALSERLAKTLNHSPELELQLLRVTALQRQGMSAEDTNSFDARLARLVEIDPVSEQARALQISLAIQEQNFELADKLIAAAKAAGVAEDKVALQLGALYSAQLMHREVVMIYDKYKLSDDDTIANSQSMLGNRDSYKYYHALRAENEPTNAQRQDIYADYLFHFFGDYEQTIQYGTKVYEMWPTPFMASRLAAAYLARSAHFLEFGNERDARAAYEDAARLKFNQEFVLQICYPLCEDVMSAMDKFKQHPL